SVAKRRQKTSRKLTERSCHDNRQESVLLHALPIEEEEQLVLDDWATDSTSEIVALVVAGQIAWERRGPGIAPTEVVERLAMKIIRARTGGDVDRAGRGQLSGQIKIRTADIEFLDGTQSDVLRGCAYVLVADVQAIEFDSWCAARNSVDRNR